AGVTILGENYMQEAREKIEALGKKVSWHFIGHLQSNKAKYAVELFDLIHSVDSLHLAESINKAAQQQNKIMPVLIQVNISGEESKHGLNPQTVCRLIRNVSALPHLTIRGLMTMPPLSESPEATRPYFTALRKLRDEVLAQGLNNLCLEELSMGMSSDFEVAIEEGATLVRIGTSLFGARGL
ncbi:MAG: YggS family pyridoxal phosphate-dependent enzyme, partial [Pseudomonadota bacterium]